MVLSNDQLKVFNDRGFIVVKGFFDKEPMETVSVWPDMLHDKIPVKGERRSIMKRSF